MEKYFPVKKAITSIVGDDYLKATKNNNEYHLFLSPTIFTDFLTEEKANNLYALKSESSGDNTVDLSPYAKKSELDPYLTEEEGDNKYKLKSENVDLSPYLKSEVAQNTYAKKTDLEEYLTEDEANNKYALKGESSEIDLPDLSSYAKKSDLDIYIEETRADNKYALKSDIDTTLTSESLQESLTDYELTSAVDNKISNLKTEIQETYYKKDDDLNVDLTDYLSKSEANNTYQKKSDMTTYAKKSELPESLTSEDVRQIINEVLDPLKEDYNNKINKAIEDAKSAKTTSGVNKNKIASLTLDMDSLKSLNNTVSSLDRKYEITNAKVESLKEDVNQLTKNVTKIIENVDALQKAVLALLKR